MGSSYQEPKFSSRLNVNWTNEADREEDLGGYPQTDRRDLGHDMSRPQFSIPTDNGAPMAHSSPSSTNSYLTDTQSILPPQATYQPTTRNGSVRMGYDAFDPGLEQGRTQQKASYSPSHVDQGEYILSLNVVPS